MNEIQVDINEVLAGMSNELATMGRRAVIAEAGNQARDRVIAAQGKEIEILRGQLQEKDFTELGEPEESGGVVRSAPAGKHVRRS